VAAAAPSSASAQSAGLKGIDAGVAVSPEDAAAIWAVLDQYMENYHRPLADYLDKNLATLLFPHVRIASHQVVVFPDLASYRDLALNHVDEFLQPGWDHSVWTKRANAYADPATEYFYPDRRWQGVQGGLTYTFARDGIPQVDTRNNVYYMAAGNDPAMMDKNVGQGSQYLWTYRVANDQFLDGGKTYRLHIEPDVPAGKFWSVVVYDSLSRSALQNGQRLPSVSSYANPKVNTDGSVDIQFGPDAPKDGGNWIRTVSGKGWFPIFRFYSPSEAYFDKTWELNDIEAES
jgi:hypothetical protein